jgi:hypothetical protein
LHQLCFTQSQSNSKGEAGGLAALFAIVSRQQGVYPIWVRPLLLVIVGPDVMTPLPSLVDQLDHLVNGLLGLLSILQIADRDFKGPQTDVVAIGVPGENLLPMVVDTLFQAAIKIGKDLADILD